MKLLIGMLLLLFPVLLHAHDYDSIALYTPRPPYPDSFWNIKKPGRVRVSYVVQADGGVNKIKVLESTSLGYSRVVERTLKKWRFKPWVVKDDRPSEIGGIATFAFSGASYGPAPREINAQLHQWLCSDVIKNVRNDMRLFSNTSLQKMEFFWSTRSRISEAIVNAGLSDAERSALLDKLDLTVSRMVRKCNENPESQYQDYLPEEIKILL